MSTERQGASMKDTMQDLLCALQHLCARNGEDFDTILARARGDYIHEAALIDWMKQDFEQAALKALATFEREQ